VGAGNAVLSDAACSIRQKNPYVQLPSYNCHLEVLMELPLTQHIRPGEEGPYGPAPTQSRQPLSLQEYERAGGYQAMRKALQQMAPADVTAEVKAANLRGRGGAGFPTGAKWSFVPMDDHAPRP